MTDASRNEIAYLDTSISLDIDIGDTNDFELMLTRDYANKLGVTTGFHFYSPGTEYGGTIEEMESDTSGDYVTYRGYTWRGFLDQLIIQPPTGQSYLVVSGEANRIITQILSSGTGLMFQTTEENSGINVKRYQFRYNQALKGLTAMLKTSGARLDIRAETGTDNEPFRVVVRAVMIRDYTEELEYNGDDNINVTVKDYSRGINHLICLGQGEGTEREVIHLYAQLDGSISQQIYYRGTRERTAVYDYSSVAESADLLKYGIEHLRELMNYKGAEMKITDADLEIDDIVSARDRNAKIILSRPIIGKILLYSDRKESVEYKVKGEG